MRCLHSVGLVGAGSTWLQFSIHPAQRREGAIAATLSRYLHRIGHAQLADNPGRHEPGTGESTSLFLFAHLDRIGDAGWGSL